MTAMSISAIKSKEAIISNDVDNGVFFLAYACVFYLYDLVFYLPFVGCHLQGGSVLDYFFSLFTCFIEVVLSGFILESVF
jgi:hypothetical protein